MALQNLLIYAWIFTASISLQAQDTITFLDGRILIGAVEESNDVSTKITLTKKGRAKIKTKETLSIYSIHYKEEGMDTLYTVNEAQDLTLSRKEMYLFILGEQDAHAYYKPYGTVIGGILFGGLFGYLLHDGFYVAGVPLLYTIGSGISTVKVKNMGNRSAEILMNSAYQEGFIKVARSRKAFYALGSSTAGTLIGAVIGNMEN